MKNRALENKFVRHDKIDSIIEKDSDSTTRMANNCCFVKRSGWVYFYIEMVEPNL